MITCGETLVNLDRISRDATIDPGKVTYIIRPTAVADLVLTLDEKEPAPRFVDIGAETTTVAAYKEGTRLCMHHTHGCASDYFDLTSDLNITEEAAEAMKIALCRQSEVNDAGTSAAYVNLTRRRNCRPTHTPHSSTPPIIMRRHSIKSYSPAVVRQLPAFAAQRYRPGQDADPLLPRCRAI